MKRLIISFFLLHIVFAQETSFSGRLRKLTSTEELVDNVVTKFENLYTSIVHVIDHSAEEKKKLDKKLKQVAVNAKYNIEFLADLLKFEKAKECVWSISKKIVGDFKYALEDNENRTSLAIEKVVPVLREVGDLQLKLSHCKNKTWTPGTYDFSQRDCEILVKRIEKNSLEKIENQVDNLLTLHEEYLNHTLNFAEQYFRQQLNGTEKRVWSCLRKKYQYESQINPSKGFDD